MTATLPLIRPISDLRTDLNDVCAQAQETRQPIFMTKNGKASLVVIDSAAYEEERQRERYAHKLREAEIEERYQTATVSQKELDARMKQVFEALGA